MHKRVCNARKENGSTKMESSKVGSNFITRARLQATWGLKKKKFVFFFLYVTSLINKE